ncbi:ATP-dependent zinc metalloprotease FtsH [Treponema sp.]|uniref:ATP-dependent zinc metalloprotease FtsH n=1 Tax=Treponema sp. TaxID=166 RepID=UPI00298DDA28|nr:ATP-dependent zinc metalloprotease FtsH [Treponema sp.]MCQ2242289.1 ATP-dependent zinc metalloprotease FtsH [Treponema sp.]
MSEKNDDKNKKNENDPYDFFKLQIDNEDRGDDPKNNKPKKGIPFFGVLLTVAAILFVFNMFLSPKTNDLIDYSEFRNLVEQGQIVRVELGEHYFTGYTADASANANQQKKIGFLRPLNNPQPTGIYRTTGVLMQSFIQLLDDKGVEYKFIERQNNILLQILVNIAVPVLLIFLVYFFIFRKMGGGMSGSMFGIGGGKSKAIDEGKVKTRFSDVAGVDEAKDELVEVVDFLKEPKKYTEIGGKIPKGVLLVGPPGTGKTLLARAVAGEAGVPFFRISGSDFVEMFVGVGASRVRDLFRNAREKAPCIIFIDEIDAIGKSRVNNYGGSNDEREQTLNQLLVEMDGFDNEKGLIILAATNRADILDPALLRPGRFDRQVPVEKPDVKGREEILRIHAKNVKLDDDVDFESVAHGTTGFAGADLANVVNEAALLAVRNGHTKVSMSDMNDAIDKVSIGLKKKSRKDNEKDMRLVSIHETGHALVGAFTPDYPPVNKITVVPRSHGVGGFTQYREEEEKHFQTKKDIIAEIDTLLGGRAAEEVMLGDVSTGASNDIARATEIIKRMIVDFGMSDKFRNMTLGKGVLGNAGGEPTLVREFSEETQKYIDVEIARIMDERYKYVLKLLKAHKNLLETIANLLKEKETIEGKEFLELVKAEKEAKPATSKEPSGKKAAEKKEPAEKKTKTAPKKAKKVSE